MLALTCAAIRRALAQFNLGLITHHFWLHNQKKNPSHFHESFLIILAQPEQCQSMKKLSTRDETNNQRKSQLSSYGFSIPSVPLILLMVLAIDSDDNSFCPPDPIRKKSTHVTVLPSPFRT